jgi:hypothetical protein
MGSRCKFAWVVVLCSLLPVGVPLRADTRAAEQEIQHDYGQAG